MKSTQTSEIIPHSNEWILLFLLSVFTFLLYSNTLHGEFLLDDLRLIPRNPQIQLTKLSLNNLLKVASTTRPVAMVSFAINYYFHQYSVTGYHIINILIHIFSGIALYFFIKITLALQSSTSSYRAGKYLPYIAVLIWLVNPLHTQSVSYIIQRMNSLSALFYICSMLCYAKARLAAKILPKIILFFLCACCGFLALGTKENAAMLPFFIILYEWFFFQNCAWKWAKKILLYSAVVLIGAVVFFYLYSNILPTGIIKKGYEPYSFTVGQRLLTESRVIILYLGLLFFPHPSRLNLDYDFSVSTSLIHPPTTIAAIIIILLFIITAGYASRKFPFPAYCVLWFFGNLIIESSFIPLDLVFEHRTYLPSMLLIPGVIVILDRGCRNMKLKTAMVIITVVCCSIWTVERNQVWSSTLNMMVDSAEKSPAKARPAYNVACEFAKQGNAEKAVYWLKKSVSQKSFNRWDLLKYDQDLQKIRDTEEFQIFYQKNVLNNKHN